jgi:hypothetical protein
VSAATVADRPESSRDLQALVGWLANGAGNDQRLRQDLLLQLGLVRDRLRERGVRLPRAGIAFTCEACGEEGRVYPQSGPWVAFVPWVWFPDDERLEVAMGSVSADIGDRLFVDDRPHRGGWAGYRRLVACVACMRSHREGKRGLQRCWHEEAIPGHDWWRCDRLAQVGGDYCEEHASRPAQHRRERGQARRADGNVQLLAARFTIQEYVEAPRAAMREAAREIAEVSNAVPRAQSRHDLYQLAAQLRQIATRLARSGRPIANNDQRTDFQ